MIVVITGIIAFAFSLWFIIHTSKKKSHREHLATLQRRAEQQQRQMDAIHERRYEYLRQRQRVRNNVDEFREERGLRPMYGPNGILTEMREGWETQEDPRYVHPSTEYLKVNFNKANPKEGDLREECIIANQPEYGVRIYEFRDGRWNLRSQLKPIEFLTEDDVLL